MLVSAWVDMRERLWMKSTAAWRVPFDMNVAGFSISVLAPTKAYWYFCVHALFTSPKFLA